MENPQKAVRGSQLPPLSDRDMIARAKSARGRAYAPYSHYMVGACVLEAGGEAYEGCNVENVSYGLTICAERNAIAAMVAAGGRKIRAIAVATEDGGTPCGACLQVVSEFTDDPSSIRVLLVNSAEDVVETRLSELFPRSFSSSKVGVANSLPLSSPPSE